MKRLPLPEILICVMCLTMCLTGIVCTSQKHPVLNYGSIKISTTAPGIDTVDWPKLFPKIDSSLYNYKGRDSMRVDSFWYLVVTDEHFDAVVTIDGQGKMHIQKDSLSAIQTLIKTFLNLSEQFRTRRIDTIYVYPDLSPAIYAVKRSSF